MSDKRFYGKYRGIVRDINDPLQTFRITAMVPDIFGEDASGWAMPCLPFGADGMGFFALPTVGSGVWIEFEHGDPDYPIWTGCFVGSLAEVPPALLAPPYKKVLIMTEGGNSITLDDTPGIGGITLETSGGQKIVMSPTGLEIDNGMGAKISMIGPQISINNGALEVV